MSVFSGVIPTITLGNGEVNNLVKGLAVNTGISTLSVGVSKIFGADAATALGLGPVSGSNFLGSIVSPGLISTGVSGLSQVIGNSITNSKALGPFGPLAGNILTSVVGNLGRDLTNSIFGGGAGSKETVYFPGGGGPGEEPASYETAAPATGLGKVLQQKPTAYSEGLGGPDVVISIRYAANAAQEDAAAAEAAAQPGGTGGLPKGEKPTDQPTATTEQANAKTVATSNAVTAATTAQPTAATAQPTTPTAQQNTASAQQAAATGQPATAPGGTAVSPAPAPPTAADYTGVGKSQAEAVKATTGAAATATTTTAAGTAAADTAAKPPPAPAAWKFICAPEDISWETSAQADRISIFGANQAPVIAGVKGMRDLTMNNAIVEGFCRGKSVETKVILLEELMNMVLGPENRYIQVPVYRVSANSKVYGKGTEDGGFFIIKSVKVQEKLRDMKGKTTRAIVDISFTQVPRYQVSTGRDIASKFLGSVKGPFAKIEAQVKTTGEANAKASAAAAAAKNQGVGGNNKPAAGAGAPAAPAPQNTPSNRPRAVDPQNIVPINPINP